MDPTPRPRLAAMLVLVALAIAYVPTHAAAETLNPTVAAGDGTLSMTGERSGTAYACSGPAVVTASFTEVRSLITINGECDGSTYHNPILAGTSCQTTDRGATWACSSGELSIFLGPGGEFSLWDGRLPGSDPQTISVSGVLLRAP